MLADKPIIPPEQEIYGIQLLRGMAAWAVVLNHIQLYQWKYFPAAAFVPSWLSFGECGVDAFFIISGFIMMYSTPRAFIGWRDQAAFLTRRFLRIYPAYWVATLPMLVLWFVSPSMINSSQGNQVDLISSLLLTPSYILPLLVVAWTLKFEIYFYCVASVLFYLGGVGRLAVGVIWAGATIVRFMLHPELFNSACLDEWLSPYVLYFVAGMYLAYFVRRLKWRVPVAMAYTIIVVSLLVEMWQGGQHGRFMDSIDGGRRLLIYGLPSMLIIGALLKLEAQGSLPWAKNVAWIGDRSYSTYLVHSPVIASSFLLAAKLLHHANFLESALIALAIVLIINVPIEILYRFVEAPSHRLAKKLGRKLRPRSSQIPM